MHSPLRAYRGRSGSSNENEEVRREEAAYTENRRKESSSKEAERVVGRLGQAITLIMKGIHSTASPTVSLSDVVADSCLNLIGPYVRPSVHPSAAPFAALSLLSFPLSHAISFMISYNRPDRRGGADAPSHVSIGPGDNLRGARTLLRAVGCSTLENVYRCARGSV